MREKRHALSFDSLDPMAPIEKWLQNGEGLHGDLLILCLEVIDAASI
jgi:hypothetical protein